MRRGGGQLQKGREDQHRIAVAEKAVFLVNRGLINNSSNSRPERASDEQKQSAARQVEVGKQCIDAFDSIGWSKKKRRIEIIGRAPAATMPALYGAQRGSADGNPSASGGGAGGGKIRFNADVFRVKFASIEHLFAHRGEGAVANVEADLSSRHAGGVIGS